MDIDNLKTLKYSELQKLAKKNGIKANQKADKLIAALQKGVNSVQHKLTEVETTNKSVSSPKKGRKSRQRGRNASQESESAVGELSKGLHIASKTVKNVKKVFTPIQKPTPKVRLITPKSLRTPNSAGMSNITPSNKVINMPKSATPHPRKSTGATARVSCVKSKTPKGTKQKVGKRSRSASRRTSPRIAAQETTKQNQDDEEVKKVRRSTFEINKDGATDTKNKSEEAANIKEPANASCSIPRFSAFLAAKKKATSSATKDWSKVHQKQFEKMESIDAYLARKRKRTDELSSSVKKAKNLTERTKNAVENLKAYRTPPASANKKPKLSKPAVIPPPSFQSPKVFVPKAMSTKSMSVQFDMTTKSSSVFVFKGTGVSTRKSINAGETRKSIGSGLTPFKFKGTGNTTMPGPLSAKKATFDLKASLAKPLPYKPYTGKLAENKKLTIAQAKENLKKPKVLSMSERRARAVKQRGHRKHDALNARRGIKI